VVGEWAVITLNDVTFFAAAIAVIAAAYAAHPKRWLARSFLLVALVILAWSLANAAWLLTSGVQLQLGVVPIVARHPGEFFPQLRAEIRHNLLPAGIGGAVMLGILAWLVWRLVRPVPVEQRWRHHAWRALAAVTVLTAATIAHPLCPQHVGMGSLGQVLDFSSHSCAFSAMILGPSESNVADYQTRTLPRVGQRKVPLPDADTAETPNILILMLESISYQASGLSDVEHTLMPNLAQLAAEGVEFANTRVPVPQTGKAFWAVLLGTTPDIYPDYAEAVLVAEPYEGLPSLLHRRGYRCAFFQMAKGSFECAPGTFANFAFDWAWFRENLEDPSAQLGYFSGDDFRMLDPAFTWVTQDSSPFLLVMITSAGHDPYELPAWYCEPAEDNYQRYLQCVRYTDDFIGELLERLRQLGIADNTLICVLGDHGESFRADLRRVRWGVYEELLRIPWVIRWPGHVPAGKRCDWPCSQIDVTPTILSLLGYDISEAGFNGVNAMSPTDPQRRLYFSAWWEGSPLGYVEGSRKHAYWPRNDKVFEYDLISDPTERSPIAVEGPERERVIADVMQWQQDSHIVFDSKGYQECLLYERWWVFTVGRHARARYTPRADGPVSQKTR
jgi:lipoteichoic acid synthase